MSSIDPGAFNDPALKRAIQRVWGQETAPVELRRRVAEMLQSGGATSGMTWSSGATAVADEQSSAVDRASEALRRRRSPFWGRHPLFGVGAAAAALLLGMGSVAAVLMKDRPTATALQLPPEFTQKLIKTHDNCSALADHHLLSGVSPNDFQQIATRINGELHVPVASEPIAEWQFYGANICPVGLNKSGHLVYHRGESALSLFTLPTSALPAASLPSAKNQATFDKTVDGRAIAGFVQGSAVYFVVAHRKDGSTVAAADVDAIRDKLRREMNAIASGPDQNVPPAQVAAIFARIVR
jgi:hypothetical protein